MLSYVAKHSKLRKTTKVIKLQWIATIWHQNYQKCWVTSQNIQNNAKLRKWSNYNGLHRFDVKNIKPTQNYKSDHITMKLHRFDVKTIKTTQNYKRDQITYPFASIWRQNIKTIKNVVFRRKTFKTTQNYESDQITTDCIDLMSKTSNQRKTTKVIILRWNCIDLTSKRSKQRKTTNAIKLRNLHRFDVKTSKRSKMLCFVAKNFKTTQHYKSDQIRTDCIDLM